MRVLIFIILLILPSFASGYCIYISQLSINNKNNSKIHSILNDIPYPSIKIKNNILSIYSGKFKKFNDAKKLLPLTLMRYKNAKVVSCNDAKKYLGGGFTKREHLRTSNKKTPIKNSTQYYCLKIYESTLNKSVSQKNKIQYILNRLPNTKTQIKNNKFYIYSGIFDSIDSALTISKVLKKEFKDVQLSTCKYKQTKKYKKKIVNLHKEFQEMDKKETFNIEDLDEKGYIHQEIASSSLSKKKNNIKKSDIRHALDMQRGEYFNGLYLKLNTAYDTLNSDPAYDIRLEFDVFDQGYYESKKKNMKNKIENKINFYRTIKNIEILQKEQEFLKIKKYENSINVSALLLKLKVVEENLYTAKRKLHNGLISEYEYEDYKLSIQKIKDDLLLFKSMSLLKIPKDLWILLNEIENTKLISEHALLTSLQEDSIDLKLAQTFQEREPLGDEWSDKLRVNLYAGSRKMYLSQNQTLVGIEAKIPISNFSKTKELYTIQNKIMSYQIKLQYTKSKDMLRDSIATFRYKQRKLKTYSYELSKIKKHIKDLNTINNSAYASYANLSFTSEQKVIDAYLEKYTQIQRERINTYKELVNIMYLIHANSIKDVLSYAIYH